MGTAMIYISLYSAESMRKNLKSLISKNAKRGFSDVRFCFPERFFQYENKETFANEAIIGKIQRPFTENIMTFSHFTDNKMTISRFTKKNFFFAQINVLTFVKSYSRLS